jgi:lipopolysaccharide assembly outer membrane protein LptD (OstA)
MILVFFLILSQDQGLVTQKDTVPGDSVDIVKYSAKKILYDLENSIIILRDSSIITYRDIILHSDSAHYHVETNQLEAFGKCDLKQKYDSIKGNFLRYNIENRKAVMTNGKTQIDKGFLEGKEIYWIDEKTVNAYRGRYTTCSDTPPHYYFYSPKMKVYLGDMVIAKPLFLYVQGFPVAAAPFWFVPISSKRKSGLLPFRVGNSRDFGKYIRGLAYYLVISDYADVTFQIDAMEKRGIMPHIEGLWNFAPYSRGTAHGSYIRETNSKIERYNIELRNSSEYFLLGSSFNCDIKYLSDNTYQQDYSDTTVLRLEKEITSQATLTRDIAGVKNSIIYERKENFTDTIIYEKCPYYTFTTPSRMLFSTIGYGFSGHLSRNRSSNPQATSDVSGANLHTTPTMQQNIFHLFTVSPIVDLDLAVFDEDTLGNSIPTRFGYSFGATANTNLYRVFNIDLLGMHGMLHKISPSMTYLYTPDFSFGRFPSVYGIPNYAHTNNLGFGVDQVFEAKITEELKKQIIVRLGVHTGYNLITDSLSSILYSVEFPYNPFPAPITKFTTRVNGSYNYYNKDYTYIITNTSALKMSFFSINLNQSYAKDGIYQIWFNGDIKPTRNWSITYAARYDWENKELVDYSFGLNRDLHCWEAVFNFNQLGDTWRYDFQIRIKEIPDVTIGKGLLGYIIE